MLPRGTLSMGNHPHGVGLTGRGNVFVPPSPVSSCRLERYSLNTPHLPAAGGQLSRKAVQWMETRFHGCLMRPLRACLLYGSLSMANHKSREGRWRGGNGFAHQTRTKSGSEAWRLSFTDGAGNKRKTASYQGLPAAKDTVFSQQSVSRTSRMGQRSQSGDFLQMVFPRCTIWAW